ncbi:DNA glycosylase/AP lyase [Phlebopus sp. FC_14]|nr:DNA glycosylase/AP lyase [Phlebopus sp. FC_14]
MPELPEVERAAALVRVLANGKRIDRVETTQDNLVFSGITHEEFSSEVSGRLVKNAARYGKCFYIELDGSGRIPVLHFGMTGMLQVRGRSTPQYRSNVGDPDGVWPPRFVKFILHIQNDDCDPVEIAFCDARRLGRIRLVASPLTEPPISELGFDPVLSMPSLENFQSSVLKRTCPIKALLLDQSFSAGVGNYLADEILYQAKVHPEQRCNTLANDQVQALHQQVADVCRIAVQVNADDSKYPEHWLFKHRWGKGKKAKSTMKLHSGELADIRWVTVGGRTSAYVPQIQKLPTKRKRHDEVCEESDVEQRRSKRQRSKVHDVAHVLSYLMELPTP